MIEDLNGLEARKLHLEERRLDIEEKYKTTTFFCGNKI
jgi:hypothetical protein